MGRCFLDRAAGVGKREVLRAAVTLHEVLVEGALRLPRLARRVRGKRRVEVVPHCFSTGVLVAASLHFAAALDAPTLSEFSVADSPLAGGLLRTPFHLDDGRLKVPTEPGLGIDVDEAMLDRLRVS